MATFIGTAGNDLIVGGSAADLLQGLAGADTLNGGTGGDTLDGGAGADSANGGAGDDVFLISGTLARGDRLTGGAGFDAIRVTSAAPLILTGLQFVGIEAFDGGGGDVQGEGGDDVFDFSGFARVTNVARILGYDGDDVITGSGFADEIWGGNDVDVLTGLGGDDVIFGGAGEDTIYGGAGDDRLDGKTGNDALYGGAGADTLVFLGVTAREDVYFGGSGVDTIFIATGRNPMTLSSLVVTDIERFDGSDWRIVGTGEGNVLDFSTFQVAENVGTVEGLNGDDLIVGSAWDDRFFGGQGNDTLDGGRGSDRATGGGGADVFRFVASTSGGGDVIEDFDASGNDVVRFEGFGFGGATGEAARLAAIEDATTDVAGGARIDLAALGGSGAVLLAGLDKAEVSFTLEDFAFG